MNFGNALISENQIISNPCSVKIDFKSYINQFPINGKTVITLQRL